MCSAIYISNLQVFWPKKESAFKISIKKKDKKSNLLKFVNLIRVLIEPEKDIIRFFAYTLENGR